ncbi:hypothetical protein LINGRAHAP2_LOCUS19693 [Linum grandiflorum]
MFTGRILVDENFKEGLNLHNVEAIVDPIQLNDLLSTPTAHHNRPSGTKEETKKCLQEILTSIPEIGIACSSNNPKERVSMSEVLSKLTALKNKLCVV